MTERYFAAANTGVVTEVSQKDYEEQLMTSDDVVFLTETELRELRGFIDRVLGEEPADKPAAWLELVTLSSGNNSPPAQEWRVTLNPPTSDALRKPLYLHKEVA